MVLAQVKGDSSSGLDSDGVGVQWRSDSCGVGV